MCLYMEIKTSARDNYLDIYAHGIIYVHEYLGVYINIIMSIIMKNNGYNSI